jgi:hypothetical protein
MSANKEEAELRVLFQIITDDIKYAKRLQWTVTYYVLVTYAAIIGFVELLNSSLPWREPLYSSLILFPAFGINLLGMWHLMDMHKHLSFYRRRLNEIEKKFEPVTRKILDITDEPKEKYESYTRYFWSLTLPFIILTTLGLFYVAWWILGSVIDLVVILSISGLTTFIFFVIFFLHFTAKVQVTKYPIRRLEMKPKLQRWAWWFISAVLGIACLSVILGFVYMGDKPFLGAGQLIILSLTLAFIILYARDTNRLANAQEEKWETELEPRVAYQTSTLEMPDRDVDLRFRLINLTNFYVEVRLDCNFKVSGDSVKISGAYDGTEVWPLSQHEAVEGHFRLARLLETKGKTLDQIRSGSGGTNGSELLTMEISIEAESETGRKKKYPPRRYHFSFERLIWIPRLTEPR